MEMLKLYKKRQKPDNKNGFGLEKNITEVIIGDWSNNSTKSKDTVTFINL